LPSAISKGARRALFHPAISAIRHYRKSSGFNNCFALRAVPVRFDLRSNSSADLSGAVFDAVVPR
jgi:hypothetical protein